MTLANTLDLTLLLQTVVDNIPVMLSVFDEKARVVWVNREWQRVLGWSIEEARRIDVFTKICPDAAERKELLRWALTGQGSQEIRTTRRDGTVVDTSWTTLHLPDGKFLGIGQDLSERKHAEAELGASREQIRRLAGRASARVERERRDLARELHDQLGQVLTGVKMDAAFLSDQLAGGMPSADLRAKADGMVSAIDGIIHLVRRLAADLRPVVLDRLGLLAAIEWQAREFERHSGVRCRFDTRLEAVPIEPARSVHVFRVVQEALTNIMRHAQASRVSIRAMKQRQVLLIEVHDNGRGIPDGALFDPDALGLVGMRERMLLIGAGLTITRGPRKGTLVSLHVPLSADKKPLTRPRASPRGAAGRKLRSGPT